MKVEKKLTVIITLLFFDSIHIKSTDLTISKPGIYRLGANLSSTPATAGGIINITSSDVFLDLNNHKIIQNNGTSTVDGILINNGLSDIVIQNGTISGITRSGVRIGSSCSNIRISNIECVNCAIGGVDFQGTNTSTTITNCSVNGCKFYGCATTAGSAPINLVFCQGIQVSNCTVADTSAAITWTGVFVTNSTNCSFDSIIVKNNISTSNLNGFEFSAGAIHTISNCVVQSCTASGNLSGFQFDTGTTNNSIFNSQTVGTFATSGGSLNIGFYATGATNCLFQNCIANGNTSSNIAYGFRFDTSPDNSTVINSQANSNSGANGADGFIMSNGGANGIILNSSANANASTTAGAGSGATFTNSGSGTSWTFYNLLLERNTGAAGAATSFGFFLTSSTTGLLFLKMQAFNNGTTAANQISFPGGIYNGSVTDPTAVATANINSVTGVWTNIRIPN
jgi:hypothetical protein